MTSTLLFIMSVAVMLGMVSAYCHIYVQQDSKYNTRGERKVAIDCLTGKKAWNDAMETCRRGGGTLANASTVFEYMRENMNDASQPIHNHDVWVSDNFAGSMIYERSTCRFMNHGNLGNDRCSVKKDYVCKMSIDRWNWCSSLDHHNMSVQKAHELCKYLGGRIMGVSSLDLDRYSELHVELLPPSNYPTWINLNIDGSCFLTGNAKDNPGDKCVTAPELTDVYRDYGTLVLNFHSKPADWLTARETCLSEGGALFEPWEKMAAFRDILRNEGKVYTEWWVGKKCVLVKDARLMRGNCNIPIKFVCEKQK